ncbi:MAG TPA: aldehyde dehydrogenase [Candidatus Gemmiger faecavium]|nr:aldehyde dehydrogenase [Candidatus Gemmiger faecavium]
MTEQQIAQVLESQRRFFSTGKTLPRAFRAKALEDLQNAILRHEEEINAALKADLGKGAVESYMCETGMTLSELSWMRRHLAGLMRGHTVMTPLAQFAAHSFRSPSPYGNVLIMSPWNYPLMLTLEPLIDALAAGNTAVVKPSAYAPATSAVIQKLIAECFDPEYVFVVTGGRAENQALLNQKFDKIFFTGGKAVGREVLRHAAEYLTPVTLELGGKSPCIVDATANIRLAAKRIVFGKYLNCGQTCVAPDYLYCEASIRDELVQAIREEITAQFGADPLQNENYGKIINQKHFERILGLIDPAKVVAGGNADAQALRIAPTVMTDVTFDDAVMGEEIFGPILPVLTWNSLDEAIAQVESRPHPLALYFFTSSSANRKQVLSRCRFGGGCINDTIIHLATSAMPFGGVGESGMGGYHGKAGFEEFSHTRSIVDKKTWIDLPMRYQPYTSLKDRMIRMFLR